MKINPPITRKVRKNKQITEMEETSVHFKNNDTRLSYSVFKNKIIC